MDDLIVCVGAIAAPLLLGAGLWRVSRATPRGGISRLIGINALVFVFLLSVLFLPLEFYYRFADRSDGMNLTRVSERWFQRHYRFNNATVRDNIDYHYAIAPGKRRLTFLGDSVTVGHGIADVEDRFANRVRGMMGSTWEVHVFAANGLETGQELDSLGSLMRKGYRLDVLALVYSLNDLLDLLPDWDRALAHIYGDEFAREPAWLRMSFVADAWYWHIKQRWNPDLQNYPVMLKEAYGSEAWTSQRSRLLGLVDMCRSAGATLVVFTMPSFDLLGHDYPFRGIHDQLDRFWTEAGVPHLDLLASFDGYASSDLVVDRWDAHPNGTAHRIAAETMVRSIEAWVPRSGQAPVAP